MANNVWHFTAASSTGIAGSTVVYGHVMQAATTLQSTLAFQEVKVRRAGTYSRMRVHVNANTTGSGCLTEFYKNGVAGNQSFTIPAATTGVFQDLTNSDSVVAGDTVSIRIARNATLTVYGLGARFDSSGNNIVKVGSTNTGALTTASVTRYMSFCGVATFGATEDATRMLPIRTACTAKNFQVYLTTNGRTTSTTFRLRKNNTNTSVVITAGASTTGLFEDTSNSASLVQGDYVNFSCTTGTGSGTVNASFVGVDLEFSGNSVQMFCGSVPSVALATNAVRYFSPIGSIAYTTSTSVSALPVFGTGNISQLFVYCDTNAATGSSPIYMRINSIDTALTVSIPASTTGEFSDTSNTASFTNAQDTTIKIAKTDAGSTSLSWVTYLINFDSGFKPRITFF